MICRSLIIAVPVMLSCSVGVLADEVRGVVDKLDRGKHELIVSGRGRQARGAEYAFRLTRDTKVLVGKNSVKADSIRPGDRVFVTYETRDGVNDAVQIDLHPRGAALRAGIQKADGILRMLDWLLQQRDDNSK